MQHGSFSYDMYVDLHRCRCCFTQRYPYAYTVTFVNGLDYLCARARNNYFARRQRALHANLGLCNSSLGVRDEVNNLGRHTADVDMFQGKDGLVISTEQVFGEFETLRWEEGLLLANHPCI